VRRGNVSVMVALLLLLLVVGGACGGGPPAVAPRALDKALAPSSLGGDRYRLFENRDPSTRGAFGNAGPTSLVDDGAVWEIRLADRLVGTLQISTLDARVKLTKPAARRAIVSDIIPGGGTRIAVGDQEVYTLASADRTVYLWFGQRLYEVMVVKGLEAGDKPEALLADVLHHQTSAPAWEPLPPDAPT
jgi:hypothetical protein